MNLFLKILGVIIVLILLMVVKMIVDNNKTPKTIGVNNGKLAAMPNSPNAVSSQATEKEKKVEPLEFKGDIDESKEAILEIIKSMGNVNIIENKEDYIYAVFTTEKMKYKDDVEFYFDKKSKVIHFRSASRVGYSDMGLNKQRYEDIKKVYIEH
jgi:uncharacterized protein (DUF1499 family)